MVSQHGVRVVLVTAFSVAMAILTAACSTAQPASSQSPKSAATPTSQSSVVSVPMPDLGPSPAPDSVTDESLEALRLAEQEKEWQSVLSLYPNVVRPQVTFAGYTTQTDYAYTISRCYKQRGVEFDAGTTPVPDGGQVSIAAITNNSDDAVTVYLCRSEHRTKPTALPNPAQRGYLYDYLTTFLVPCYEANGITNPPPPSRADFISAWPNQNWFPTIGAGLELADNPEKGNAIKQACPPPA